MLFKKSLMFHLIFTLLFLLTPSHFVVAEEAPHKLFKATTISNPAIAKDELEIMLVPMTKEELFAEADGWLLLLKETSKKISIEKLNVIRANKEMSLEEVTEEAEEKIEERMKYIKNVDNAAANKKLKDDLKKKTKEFEDDIKQGLEESKELNDGDTESKFPELNVDIIEEQKEDLLSYLDKLRKEQRHMIDRLNLVLNAINDKIGLDENGNELDEVMPYRHYIDAVSGLKLDITDTKSAWLSAKGYLLAEDGGMKWIVNTIIFIAILLIFWGLSKILGNTAKKAVGFSKSRSQILNDFFINSACRLTFIIGILVALSAIGISVAPIMAIIGAAGFVVAFALQSTLSNFASGIMIMLYRPFDVEDLIEVAGIMGKVKSMTLVSTTIMTPDNKLMIVPNNSIWGDVIVNAHSSSTRRIDMVFGIGYDDDIEQAIQVMKQVLSNHPMVLDEPQSMIQVSELADSSVNFICRPWVKTGDYWTVYWDVTRTVKEQFDAAGISIPFPQTDVHINQQTPEASKPSLAAKEVHQEPISDQFNEIDIEQND